MLKDSIINLEQELLKKESKVLWKMMPDEALKAHLLSWKLTKFVTLSSWFGVDILFCQQIITFKKSLTSFYKFKSQTLQGFCDQAISAVFWELVK